nr:MAG TPA: hypothetical protein [Caudoviricetes sp.]
MASTDTLIMSWSKCKIEIGKTGESDAMATALESIGTIKDKSTSLTAEDGEKLEAKASGGIVVATEEGEHKYTITTRVMEMDFAKESALTGATLDESKNELTVKTNIIDDSYSVKLTPKNIGAIGIKAPKCHVTLKPGTSEEEGNYVDITFEILATASGVLYTKFKVKADDWS